MQANQQRQYGWWPVGIVRLDDEFMKAHRLPEDVLFVTCIYQALDNEIVAWAMNASNEMDVHVLADYR